MSDLLHQFTKKYCKASVPDLRPGYLVKVHQKIKEGNKERVQVFEGTVIAVNSGHGVESTFTVRKIAEGVGVEKVYPIHSPNVVKIDVLRAHKVRRAKLRFLRALSGKALRLKEVDLKLEHKEFEQPAEEKASDSAEATPDKEEKVEEVKEETTEEFVAKKEEAPAKEAKEETTEEPKEEVKEERVEEKKEEEKKDE